MSDTPHRLIRKAETKSRIGDPGDTAFYERIKAGEFPPSVSLGGNLVAWLDNEVSAWIAARVAGATDEEIRALVRRMVEARGQTTTAVVAKPITDHPRFTGQKRYWEAVRRGEKKMPRESDEAFAERKRRLAEDAEAAAAGVASQSLAA